MGRSGGGGGHSSGGHHSHSGSRSHGSSHSHSSGRGSSSYSSHSYSSNHHSYSGGHYHNSYNRTYYGGSSYGSGYRRSGPASMFSTLVTTIILIAIIAVVIGMVKPGSSNSSIPNSTVARERVDTKNAYINDCIIDEIGWIKNKNNLSRQLQTFYKDTGCQPYIILREFDSSMDSVNKREEWTRNYYDTNFAENQNVVLYVYFCDRYDDGEGDDTLWLGTESSIVMDSEAVEIFWSYLDYDWDHWDVNDNDGMFADVFTKTSSRIMTKTTTSNDVKVTLIIGLVICFIGVCLIVIVVKLIARKRQKAQETIDILNAPINKFSDPTSDLADKYNNQ